MSTIFDGYDKLEDTQIIDQLALLETISFSNILKLYRSKFKENTVGTIKKLLGTLRKEEEERVEQEKIDELYTLLIENKVEFRKLSRRQLDMKMKKAVGERTDADIIDSEEIISLEAVSEASKKFDMPKYLTLSQRMDEIYGNYNETIVKIVDENQDIINASGALNLTDNKMLLYVFIETIKSWDMIQGSKKIDREVLAQCIWLSAVGNGRQFTPLVNELPSFKFKPDSNGRYLEDVEFLESRSEYRDAIENLDRNDYKLLELERQIDKLKEQIIEKKSQLIELNDKKTENERKLREIEVDLEFVGNIYDQEQRNKKNNDLVMSHRDISDQNANFKRDIDVLEYQIKDIEIDLSDIELDKEYLLREERNLKFFRNDARREYMIEADKRFYSLKELWEAKFSGIVVEAQFLKEALEYSIQDRIKIERVIEEIRRSRDPRVLSDDFKKEQIKNQYSIEFLISNDKVLCLEYKVDESDFSRKVKLSRLLESTK